MFRIFTYKNLCILSVTLSLILLISAALNTAAPYIMASVTAGVKLPIIMYHHICDKEIRWGDYVIPSSLLESDFLYFKENDITPISFAELNEYVRSKKTLPSKPIIITFDDGQKSFLTKAVPLLEKYNYPANINIVGALTELYTENGENNDNYAYLNRQDVENLCKNSLIEIGCHTYNFHSLTQRKGIRKLSNESDSVYSKIFLNDLNKFNSIFFEITNTQSHIFAYPYGIRNDTALNLLKSQGYTVTLTCRESVNIVKKGDDLYELGRFNRPYGISSENFFGKLFE